ncbi:MAG: DNA pilot protein [Microviridae sp.]|nr:MAG: DNA pilot protein [Microviridae sp.]
MGIISAIPNLIGGLGSALGTALSARRENQNIKMANEQNKYMANYQYNKDLENWNRVNLYNSPEQQMARFKAAGLNPNLIYSRGSSGLASEIPRYQAPQADFSYRPYTNIPEMLSKYQEYNTNRAGLENKKAQNMLLNRQYEKEGITLNDLQNTYFANWGPENAPMKGTKFQLIKQGLKQAMQNYEAQKLNMSNVQAAIELRKQQQALNAYQLAFQNAGGAFFAPGTNMLNTILSGLKMWLLKK